jgi:hypothetical protein
MALHKVFILLEGDVWALYIDIPYLGLKAISNISWTALMFLAEMLCYNMVLKINK